jgi:phosphotransferase system HPr (HPr) family protein
MIGGSPKQEKDEMPLDGQTWTDGIGVSAIQECQPTMNGTTLQRKVVVTNYQGFHFRPVAAFAELAGRFQSDVYVRKDEKRVNGKSPLEMMFLAAEKGTELILEATGPDAQEVLDSLAAMVAGWAAEEDAPEPPLPPKG